MIHVDDIGQRIKEARLQKGFTLRGFAKHIGMDCANLSRIERGATGIGMITLNRVAVGLDISPETFLQKTSPEEAYQRGLQAAKDLIQDYGWTDHLPDPDAEMQWITKHTERLCELLDIRMAHPELDIDDVYLFAMMKESP